MECEKRPLTSGWSGHHYGGMALASKAGNGPAASARRLSHTVGRGHVIALLISEKGAKMKGYVWVFFACLCVLGLLGYTPRSERIESENKALVQRFGEASNARQFDVVEQLLAGDFVRHCQATPDVDVRSREQFIEYLKNDAAVFPDSKQTLQYLVAEGDMVAFLITYEGTQEGQMGPFPPSHKKMKLDVAGMFRVRDGKLAELWVTWDNLAALMQLGYFPPQAAAQQ